MKHIAIYNLYPEVKGIKQDGDTFIALDSNENEVSIDMSAVNTKADELQAIEDAKPSREELKTSAKAKLVAGEALTEEEADTIVL
tara:strand:- start:101 stop:355 length:255 start_codon:yes stop_codon:yes gene_type:complete